MLNMLAANHHCWLPDPSSSLLYSSPSDQSSSFAESAQPSPTIPKGEESSKLVAPFSRVPPIGHQHAAPVVHHQHFASFVQSAFGTGFPPGGTIANAVERTRPAKRRAKPVPEEKKDESYRERRRKNNDSARRSREMRRRKEEEAQMRNAELEQENDRLRHENYALMLELFQLRQYIGGMVGGNNGGATMMGAGGGIGGHQHQGKAGNNN